MTTNYSSDLLPEKFLQKYINKEVPWGFNGLGYIVYKRCVTVETPVLCDDLQWRPAGSLKEGDGIIGFDEYPIKRGKGNTRKFRFGKVMFNDIEMAETVKITLDDGTELFSTPDHPWLAHNGNRLVWVEAKDLVHINKFKQNELVHYRLPKVCDVWQMRDLDYNAGYIAGVFDGEGSIDRCCTVQMAQTKNIILETVEKILLEGSYPIHKKILDPSAISKKPCYILAIFGSRNVLRFLGNYKPKRLYEKFLQRNSLEELNLVSKPKDGDNVYRTVVKVEPAGKRAIAVLSTDIKTHITAGYPSHNTYARKIEGTDQTEEWWQTVARCINGAQEIGADYTPQEAQRLYDLVFNLKCNFAGRMLWQLGTETVKKFGANSLLNCWYVSINDPKTFLFIFENLMLGGGVGFSIRREDIHELPKVKKGVDVVHKCTKDADFIVPDSRSGWVEILRKVLDAYYVTGKSFSYSTILVRGAGERISGFGGTASGPGILIEGIEKISKILQIREGKKLRSTDVLDICNIIGSIVVAGNVRRSAQIALGDPDDYLYLRAKNWSLGNIPNWRAMSNNTIYADDFSHISNEIWTNGYIVDKETGFAKGEPYGFFNLPLSQKFGRLKDGAMKSSKLYPTNEDNVLGTNPCAEISLTSYECCNLSELYLNNITSVEELVDCATLLYKTQKATAAMPFIHDETNKIVHKNMRLGLGVTGICQCSDEKIEWLDKGYEALRKFDKEWSKTKGYPESIKLTTVKPSGTLSLLAGSTPGVHPAYSPFYIRRVRMGSDDKLVNICRDLGYHVEFVRGFDGKDDHSTVVVSFPCSAGNECVVAKSMTAVQQLDLVKKLQTYWSDNAVSVTVYYKQEELEEIKAWLEYNYESSIKSVSFLLHNEHGFAQAPYEEITEEEYQKLTEKVKPITAINIGQGDIESMECEGGACPIK